MGQHNAVPLLGGPVRCHQVVTHGGTERLCNEHRRAGDEAVDNERAPHARRAQRHARKHADLKAANLGQYVKAVGRVRRVDFKGASYDCRLVRQLFRVAPGACARRLLQGTLP